jgi:uncharacterized coiled-coil protein SlyX
VERVREELEALTQRIEARQAEIAKTQHNIDNTQDKVQALHTHLEDQWADARLLPSLTWHVGSC